VSRRYRWVVLGLGIAAQAAFAALITGFPSIGPAIREEYGLSLSGFGTLLGAITAGATITLVPWGLLTDRIGERISISVGLAGASAALFVSATGGSALLAGMLLVAGALGAVANVASGRVVMGWFDFAERGMAFGLRQAAVPLGGAVAAFTLPALVATTDARAGLVALAVGGLLAAAVCAVWLREPSRVRPPAGLGPLRDRRVYRLAVASGLLVVSQAAVIGFVVLFLHEERGMDEVAAGVVLAVIQVIGVGLRVAAGRWSDRLARRVVPLRWAAATIAVTWLVVPILLDVTIPVLVPVVVVGGAVTFGWNGLSFNAAAELAAEGRSGTAIAIQQTALFASASFAPPLFGWLVSATSWRLGFWALAVGPALSWLLLRPLARSEAEGSAIGASPT
jgi:sugar phosphate permease